MVSNKLNRITWVCLGLGILLVTYLPRETPLGQNSMEDTEPQFPTTLEGFGYRFNDRGQLRNIQTGKPFEFAVSTDATYNQKRYEALGKKF